jgi:hypothetical protein
MNVNQAPGNEIPDTLSILDWHQITCQSDAGCKNLATHIVHLHAVDECDNPDLDSSGNLIGILCIGCVQALAGQVQQRVGWLNRHPGVQCLTCGSPVRAMKDVLRAVAPL